MQDLKAIFSYTFKEQLRDKAWLSSALFGLILMAGGLVASALAQQERARMMLDLGLAAVEALALVAAVFLTVHLILREIESRAVFLILTHPVPRWRYLLGRWLGTMAAIALAMLVMGAAHWLAMTLFGGVPLGRYAAAWFCALGKTAVMSALALLLSLALTSEVAAMAFASFFWVLGHFSSEMRFLAERSGSVLAKSALMGASYAAPDFARLNYRDFWHSGAPEVSWLLWAGLYVLAYCGACLALSTQVFEQKEF